MTIRTFIAATITAILCSCPAAAQTNAPPVPPLYATISAPGSQVFLNEIFPVTLSVYARGVSLESQIRLAALPGGEQLRIGAFKPLPVERRQLGDEVQEIRRFRADAMALQTGTAELAPVLRVVIGTRRQAARATTWIRTERTVKVRLLKLEVVPIPEEARPPIFSGAVGQFAFNVSVKPDEVAVGDLVKARMTISGKGWLEDLPAPRLSPGRHFRVYDPERIEYEDLKRAVYEQVIIPQNTNAVSLPPVSFCFFEPKSATFRTVTHGPFALIHHESTPARFESYTPPTSLTAQAGLTPADGPEDGVLSSRTNLMILAAAALAAAWLVFSLPIRRRTVRTVLFVLLVAILWVAAAEILRSELFRKPSVRLASAATARLAPAHSALELFACPEGARVQPMETHADWVKIQSRDRRGWIPADAIAHQPRATLNRPTRVP